MEQNLPASRIVPFPQDKRAEVDALLARAAAEDPHKIIVLDDDPTGVQTVHDVNVYTDWSKDSLQEGFREENKLFFILTNSRGMTAAETEKAHREIIGNIRAASSETGFPYLVVSRSDSTLRGHFPLETQILADGMGGVDGEILCPYFREGGRFTLDDVHYVRYGDELVPAAETEFARDRTFGYHHSNLKEYVEEKTGGVCRAGDVISITLAKIRALDIDSIAEKLLSAENHARIIVNAADDYDVKVVCIALYRALQKGKRFCYRTAAAFVKSLGNISDRPLLSRQEMVGKSENGGVIVVGSHTEKTTRQLEELMLLPGIVPIEMNSDLVLASSGELEQEAARITRIMEDLISSGRTPAVYTRRKLLTVENDTPEAALTRSVRISDAVQSLVGGLRIKPAFVIAKGGITSSDIGTKALRVRRARVLGQIRPGIPVWQTGPESLFPGVPYVIFPGNVGEVTTLREAAAILMEQE